MPANFGEIATYHSRLAVQHMALAQAARDRGDLNAAEYNRELAARYIEAAEEQKTAMSQAPDRRAANQARRPWTQKPSQALNPTTARPAQKADPGRTPLALTCLSALRRGAGSVATALPQSLSHAHVSLQNLSLPDAPPAPQLRG